MLNKELIKRAVVLFPRTEYTDTDAVRHARRKWLESVQFLRSPVSGSLWILDTKIPAQKYPT
jgi:hypothetical protein